MRGALVCSFAALCALGCDKSGTATDSEVRPPTAADLAAYTKDVPGTGPKLLARIETNLGTLNCELYADKAPMTVANFVGLATGKKPWRGPSGVQTNKPFYEGLVFHRVIPGFMIQGGDPTGTGSGDPGYEFGSEFPGGQEMSPGTLAMANAGPTTNGSQFFVMEGARPDLVGKHTIFGKCAELDVVQKITHTPSTSTKPNEPVTMKITIRKGA
ncbi:MAG TPA: peptidylprolyl isomerase [Labilithrix sp.]|nr:peptidylprolyl isomerase [Labilithrix sp.]